jgi:hypothetical protein
MSFAAGIPALKLAGDLPITLMWDGLCVQMKRFVGYAALFFAAAATGSTLFRLCGSSDRHGGTDG